MDFELHLIKSITNNFSKNQEVGSGAYGAVYRVMNTFYNNFSIST